MRTLSPHQAIYLRNTKYRSPLQPKARNRTRYRLFRYQCLPQQSPRPGPICQNRRHCPDPNLRCRPPYPPYQCRHHRVKARGNRSRQMMMTTIRSGWRGSILGSYVRPRNWKRQESARSNPSPPRQETMKTSGVDGWRRARPVR